jgi:hypothetical protein
MGTTGRWVILGAVLVCICVGLSILAVARGKEQACADYTYKDAVRYVLSNLDGSGLEQPAKQAGTGSTDLSICTAQDQTGLQGGSYVVDLCSRRTGEIVGHAEVYPDCGLEWRRR